MFKSVSRIAIFCGLGLSMALLTAVASEVKQLAFEREDGKIVSDGGIFKDWSEYVRSDWFEQNGGRCAIPDQSNNNDEYAAPVDCGFNLTNPLAIYDGSQGRYRIPVVVHVIQSTSGSGFISEATVNSQIDVLNEDFLALSGTNGAPGYDVQIEFYLAQVDPSGNLTNGITYTANNSWYNDSGSYWNTLAWDTSRYLNIYTNTASGALGYVPSLPQSGVAGNKSDRVVILWTAFGRNAPIGPPFNLGRTVTHEVGHYLGLYHTFNAGCGSSSACYTSGDRICDTEGESSPTSGCPGSKATCGSLDPVHNYLDYSSDICMWEFTREQSRRMRCSLESYRSDLYEVANPLCGNLASDPMEQCDDGNNASGDGCSSTCIVELAPDEVSPLGSAQPLMFTDATTLVWEGGEVNRATSFNVYSGRISRVRVGDLGGCLVENLTTPSLNVTSSPASGKGYAYLVSGENPYGEGSAGSDSSGAVRTEISFCP
jgi:cysteine-rich repeat protein